MSHIVKIKTEVRDTVAAEAACRRLGLSVPTRGTAKLFRGEATGLIVQLPDWKYPVVFDTSTGQARYDNYEGRWGDQRELGRFMQAYGVEKTKITARRHGHTVHEQQLADGSVKLTVQLAGGVA